MGTPITGNVECAATTPARCAAAPAPIMNTFTPRPGASRTRRITRSGERWADATVISQVMPNSFNTSPAADIVGASESDPISIRTLGIHTPRCLRGLRGLHGFGADVSAILHAVERNPVDGLVGPRDGGRVIRRGRDNREHAAAGRHDLSILHGGAGVKDFDAIDALRGVDAVDGTAGRHRAGISLRREDH